MTALALALDRVTASDISLGEAYSIWFSGRKIPDDTTLYGLGIVWWGRAGKFVAFLSGTVAILDIIGAERLQQWGMSREGWRERITSQAAAVMGLVLLGTLLVLSAHPLYGPGVWPWILQFLTVAAAAVVVRVLIHGLARAVSLYIHRSLTSSRPARGFRVIAFVAFVVGFHFDFLAS